MIRILYTVTATLPDEATADAYVTWLRDGHIRAVINAGAHSGLIVRLERDGPDDPFQVQTVYIFPTRVVFDRYLSHTATGLRAQGVERFGGRGVTFLRRVGQIV